MTSERHDLGWLTDLLEGQSDYASNERSIQVPANDYATTWKSAWTNPEHGIWNSEDLKQLRHVNCSYLSSGKAPTLLALKQHAQSLTNLIRKLSVSSTDGIVDGRMNNFQRHEAFDWLNDLSVPYTNEDNHHNTPLYAVANQIKSEAVGGNRNNIEHRCPLQPVLDFGPFAEAEKSQPTRKPYQTHSALLQHANECLEILDHEYSATGGFMSILPSNQSHDKKQMEGARNTLIGQWLYHHQLLVARMHELEISYANALDLLAGEAVVPLQMLSSTGVDARSLGRNAVYPQDRFVLVNSGDDVFNTIHEQLDTAENNKQARERDLRNNGVVGDVLTAQGADGVEVSQGIVYVTLPTRFYRLMGDEGHGTLFVLPAADIHSGVQHTRTVEKRPTVVSVVTPTWPERVTDYQRSQEAKRGEGEEAIKAKRVLLAEREERKLTVVRLNKEVEEARQKVEDLEAKLASCRRGVVEAANSLSEAPRGILQAAIMRECPELSIFGTSE